jgi:hypothetical protein
VQTGVLIVGCGMLTKKSVSKIKRFGTIGGVVVRSGQERVEREKSVLGKLIYRSRPCDGIIITL